MKKQTIKISLVLLIVLFIFSSCATPTSVPSNSNEHDYKSYSVINEMGQKVLEADKNVSLSIALMSDHDLLWTQEFGYADQESQIPVTSQTLFNIGSVSKVFTAAAIMQLVDQGKVSLDDPVVTYLPDFEMQSEEYKDITIRMLLNHSSGLPGSYYRGGMTIKPWDEYQEAAYKALKNSRLKHKPGYMNVYCNDGFTLAEIVIQKVTGMPFTEYVQKELFDPLGMDNSRFATGSYEKGTYAGVYHQGEELPMEYMNIYGAGGIVSTPTDLVRFMDLISSQGIVNQEILLTENSLEAMEKDQTQGKFKVIDNTEFLRYGLGWDNVSHPAIKYVGKKALTKNGGTMAYTTELWVIPEENLGVAVTGVNAPDADLAKMAEKALLAAMVDKGTLDKMPEPVVREKSPAVEASKDYLESLSGYYANYQSLYRVDIEPDNKIEIQMRNEEGWEPFFSDLSLRGNDWFASEDIPEVEFRFTEKDGREYIAMRQAKDYYNAEYALGQRLHSGANFSSVWENRMGKTWVLANDLAISYTHYYDISPKLKLLAQDDLPGNIFAGEADEYLPLAVNTDTLATMDILIPIVLGRDLSDLEVIDRDGQEWLTCRGNLYRPLEDITKIKYGSYLEISVQEKYLTEWVCLEQVGIDAQMIFNGPEESRWIVWDSEFNQVERGWGSANIDLKDQDGPHYVALYAEPGQIMDLSWQ
ncbi:MAG: beta-lactamase family protein [Spirochaetia bacterium]|nr:beta-lactamase family protein [Spirochaetia bacterium]MCF7953073.1 beta-lactamase family protein [Spirochaetales bacterium]